MTDLAEPSVTDIKKRFPEFTEVDSKLIQAAIDEAGVFMSTWNTNSTGRDVAWKYMTAHILSTNQFAADNSGQDVSSETIGRISIRYRDIPAELATSDLLRTSYGRRYLQFKNISIKKFQTILPAKSY